MRDIELRFFEELRAEQPEWAAVPITSTVLQYRKLVIIEPTLGHTNEYWTDWQDVPLVRSPELCAAIEATKENEW